MTICFSGGGTLGPVTPLIAVLRRMREKRPGAEFVWAGTPNGPERAIVEAEGARFYAIPVAKLPRYLSVDLLRWPFRYAAASRESAHLLDVERPVLAAAAGGFSSVPVLRAAHGRGIPVAIHQLDRAPGLANRLLAGVSRSVTTSFAYAKPPFRGVSAEQVPTPCRFAGRTPLSKSRAAEHFGLDPSRPIVLAIGGGTGALALNEAMIKIAPRISEYAQIIHQTGRGKAISHKQQAASYLPTEFLNEDQMFAAFCAADVVVSRAGMGAMTELACLSKAAIFVPIPHSHQEQNVAHIPVEVVSQRETGFEKSLEQRIIELIRDESCRRDLGEALHNALPTDDGTALAEKWLGMV